MDTPKTDGALLEIKDGDLLSNQYLYLARFSKEEEVAFVCEHDKLIHQIRIVKLYSPGSDLLDHH